MAMLPKPGDGLSDRQRRLAELIVEGHSLKSAYKLAGYDGVTGVYSPSSIVNSPDFKFYIFHLRERAVERTLQSIEMLVHQLDDARLLALVSRDAGGVVQAVMAKAKLLGIATGDRPEEVIALNKPSREPSTTIDLSVDEWKERFGSPRRLQ